MSGVGPLLEVCGVRKQYPNGTVALKDVSFALETASVHGLVGANGAGKSTLIKVLSGAITPTAGSIRWVGQARAWHGPADPLAAGIATIHQTIPLAPALSVMENVFLGSGRLSRRSSDERARFAELTRRVGYAIAPDLQVGSLPIGQRQMVSILQALAAQARLIIMDEPTAALAERERQAVFEVIRRLQREERTTFLFVSHFLDEVLELCDHVTVLRDGRVAMSIPRAETSETSLVEALVGRTLAPARERAMPISAEQETVPSLQVRSLQAGPKVLDVDLDVLAGEVLGLAGLLGSGRSEILHAVAGANARASGRVNVNGKPLAGSIRSSMAAGVVLVPEDRDTQALFRDRSIRWNVSLPRLEEVAAFGLVPRLASECRRAAEAIAAFAVRAKNQDTVVAHLSGGNAQKVALARTLKKGVTVLLLDEPTAGVDVGAKADIWAAVRALAQAGKAVVVVLSDFEELLAVCDRLLVVRAGRIVAELRPADTSEHELVALASGVAL